DQAQVLLCRRELDAARRLGVRLLDLRVVADADTRVAPLQPLEPHDLEPFVRGVRAEGDRYRRSLAPDLDDVALTGANRLERLAAHPHRTRPNVLRLRARNLDLHCTPGAFLLGHRVSPPRIPRVAAQGSKFRAFAGPDVRAAGCADRGTWAKLRPANQLVRLTSS